VWWQYIIIAVVLALVIYGFVTIVSYRTRTLTSKTDRTAESMYADYADVEPKPQKDATTDSRRHVDGDSTAP
jgi:hypothetical protein